MTLNEIYTASLMAMRAQGMRCYGTMTEGCYYTLPDPDNEGKTIHCGVGAVFTPEQRAEISAKGGNGEGVNTTFMRNMVGAFLGLGFLAYDSYQMAFLSRLQRIHDKYMPKKRGDSMEAYEAQMKHLADDYAKYGVVYTPVGA